MSAENRRLSLLFLLLFLLILSWQSLASCSAYSDMSINFKKNNTSNTSSLIINTVDNLGYKNEIISASVIIQKIKNGQDIALDNVYIIGEIDISDINSIKQGDDELNPYPLNPYIFMNPIIKNEHPNYFDLFRQIDTKKNIFENKSTSKYRIRDFSSDEYNIQIPNIKTIKQDEDDLYPIRSSISITNSVINDNFFLNNSDFLKQINLKGTLFRGNTSLFNSRFRDSANFEDTTFKKDVIFAESEFSEDADFNKAKFCDSSEFYNVIFNKKSIFSKAQFNWLFASQCLFRNETTFEYSEFNNSIEFHGSTFEEVNFGNTRFKGYSNFADTVFKKNLKFYNSEFMKFAYFNNAVFIGDVDFTNTKFYGATSFLNSRFLRTADFRNAEFNGSDLTTFIEISTKKGEDPTFITDFILSGYFGEPIRAYELFAGSFEVEKRMRLGALMDIDIQYISSLKDYRNKEYDNITIFRLNGYPDPEYYVKWNDAIGFYINISPELTHGLGNLTILMSADGPIQVNNVSLCANFENVTFSGECIFGRKPILPFNEFNIIGYNDKYADLFDNQAIIFHGNASFFNSTFNGSADFYGINYLGFANFNQVTFKNYANFEKSIFYNYTDFSNTYSNNFYFNRAKFKNKLDLAGIRFKNIEFYWNSLEGDLICDGPTYLALIRNFRDLGQFDDAQNCYYEYRKWMQSQKSLSISFITDIISWLFCGYGIRPSYTLSWCAFFVFLFGSFYWSFDAIYKSKYPDIRTMTEDDEKASLTDSIYYSILVFTHSNPPINWKASGRWKYLVLIEGMIGWLLLALFVVVLVNTIITW